uniref:Dishevelled-binding antagonist of beta-catenin 3a n=1 Tax=Mola mola TaxID=94237 RepID=A0A3Q3W8R6_MOLML
MSFHELLVSSDLVLPALSLPMRAKLSRNKERLEASLAGLCELELLKQRQECRVLSALCLGNSLVFGRPFWGVLRSKRCSPDAPECNVYAPWGIDPPLEQQVAELMVISEVKAPDFLTDLEDSPFCSGKILNLASLKPKCHSSEGTVETKTGKIWISEPKRQATVTHALEEMRDDDHNQEDYQQTQKVETYIFGLIQRRALPTCPLKPQTSLANDASAVSVSLRCKEEQHSQKQLSAQEISSPRQPSEPATPQVYRVVNQKCYQGTGFIEDFSIKYHHYQQKNIQHQTELYHRPRRPSIINAFHSSLLDYPSFKVLQVHPDSCNSGNSEPDSTQHFHYSSPPALLKDHHAALPDAQLVNAEYIPAQLYRASTRAYPHPHFYAHKGSGRPKPNQSTYSPERIQPPRSRGGQKKCRSNEDRGGAGRKHGKKSCRSQSENSVQRVQDCKYNTIERDGGGSGSCGRESCSSQTTNKKHHQGCASSRRWQSTQPELSQDESDQLPMQGSSASNQKGHTGRPTCKSCPTYASCAYPHHANHHQHVEYQFERVQVPLYQPSQDYPLPGQGESESSISEADSPDSSSLSSDSDESGGLVWPQQLPSQLSLRSTPVPPEASLHPKTFVKIKASHALKKKILRFRTGSLKVMTTV